MIPQGSLCILSADDQNTMVGSKQRRIGGVDDEADSPNEDPDYFFAGTSESFCLHLICRLDYL